MLVGSEGPIDAKIVIIGEAPGQEEENSGRPFVGGSGQLLDQVLNKVGLPRGRCYLTNIMQIRPFKNDFGQFYEDKKRTNPSGLLQEGIRRLHAELRQLKPNVIVPVGSEALRAVTGLRSIEKWRGSILDSQFGKVVGSYHPAAILREYRNRPILELDFQRVAKQSTFSDVRLPSHTFHIDPTYEHVLDFLRAIKAGQRISFDIETIGRLIRCLGIAISSREALCIPFMSSPWRYRPGTIGNLLVEQDPTHSPTRISSHWSEEQEYVILQELDRIFSDPSIEKGAQNAPFDATRLEKQFGIVTKGLVLDTMLAFHTLYCELPKGLDFLCSIYTEVPYYSDYNVAVDYDVWRYNCYDCAVTWEIMEPIRKDLQQRQLEEFYDYHLQPAMLELTRTENRGILVDQRAMEEERIALMAEIEYPHKKKGWKGVGTLTQKIRDMVKMPGLNPNSPKQLAELFYVTLKLPVQINHKTKQPTADKTARDTLAKRFPDHFDLFKTLDIWSTKETLVTSFLSRKPRADGRVYTHYNLAGTVTGRIASADPLDEEGTNLTNVPKGRFRRMFLADNPIPVLKEPVEIREVHPENEFLIKADLKSAEWMVVCWAAPIDRYIKLYEQNPDFDIHRFAASKNYNVVEAAVTKEQRDLSKNGVYGSGYGMQPPRASVTWKVPIRDAEFILRRWHQETPEIRERYWKRIQQQILSTRCIENLLGRKRMFFDRIQFRPSDLDQIFRDAYSHFAQSTVADVINRALSLMGHFFPESKCKILLQVHDELVATCKRAYVPEFVRLFKSFMEYPIVVPQASSPLCIQAEVTVGPNWFEQYPLKIFEEKFPMKRDTVTAVAVQ